MGQGLKLEEKAYIQQNCLVKTDEELAKHLNRNKNTIIKYRQKLGIIKTGGSSEKSKDIIASQKLTENQRKNFFQTQLANTLFYNTLKGQFTEDEIKYYLEEWGSLCVQFEDILATEKRQIDELIKAEIMGNRILRNIKVAEEEIQNFIKEVEKYRKEHPDIATKEEEQERDTQLMNLIKIFSSQTDGMSQNYQKNVDLKNKILENLNSRRRDRIDQIKRSNSTFIGIVEKFRDREIREKEGRHMELIRMAKEQKKNAWRKPISFPDGQKDCVLLDEESELPEKDAAVIDMDRSNILADLSSRKHKKILVLDRDLIRSEIIRGKFGQADLDTIKSPSIAKALMLNNNYDLIFIGESFDHDKVIPDILNNDKTERTDFILYGSSEKKLDRLSGAFYEKRYVNNMLFDNLVKALEK